MNDTEKKDEELFKLADEEKKEIWVCDGCGHINPSYIEGRCSACEIPKKSRFDKAVQAKVNEAVKEMAIIYSKAATDYESDKPTPAGNPILDAYYRGEKVRRCTWPDGYYIVVAIVGVVKGATYCQNGEIKSSSILVHLRTMHENPDLWELYPEQARTYSGAREVMQALLDEKCVVLACNYGLSTEWRAWIPTLDTDRLWFKRYGNNGSYNPNFHHAMNTLIWTEVQNEQ